MQNNVTELTQRLLRALDSNYNVIDMPAVVEILSLLEQATITKELLETTRLGKHVNELRRKANNDSLSKRAKELVKKWRDMVLPESNGQLKSTPPQLSSTDTANQQIQQQQQQQQLSTQLLDDSSKLKKRPTKDSPDTNNTTSKRPKVNGQMSELEFSDNSNSSFKDVIYMKKHDVILLHNSDSNSSLADTKQQPQPHTQQDPLLEQQQPKKRGRKKGSKNHKNLLDEAESSFTNKLASVSRGNSKVKTTQELIAGLQNKNLNSKPKEDLQLRAAKLTERVSIIDQKLNTNANRYRRNLQRIHLNERNDRVIESGSVINDKSLMLNQMQQNDEDIIVVDDIDVSSSSTSMPPIKSDLKFDQTEFESDQYVDDDDVVDHQAQQVNKILSLSVEDALSQLPPIDKSILNEPDDDDDEYDQHQCICCLNEIKRDFSIDDDDDDDNIIDKQLERQDEQQLEQKLDDQQPHYGFVEDVNCPAKCHFYNKYKLGDVTDGRVDELHRKHLPNVNGNYGVGVGKLPPELQQDNGLYVNVVPNVNNETLAKDFTSENYKKYSISEEGDCCDGNNDDDDDNDERTGGGNDINHDDNDDDDDDNCSSRVFREWHEVLDTPSYNGEIMKILPYVIID